MDAVTFAWTIATTIFAGVQLFVQRMVAKEGRDSAFAGFLMYAVSLAFALAMLPAFGIPDAWLLIAAFGLLSGATHGLGNFLRLEALKDIDSVIYFPINKVLGPILVVIGGVVLFSEALVPREYLGIALSLSVPLLLISAGEHARQNNLRRGLAFLVFSTVLTSIAMLFSKAGTDQSANIVFLLLTTQVAGVLSSAMVFYYQRRPHLSYFAHLGKRDIILGLTIGILSFLAYFTFLTALSTGYVSLVYVIHAHYILIPIILSVWWYKDHINPRKLLAIVVSSLAILLLYES